METTQEALDVAIDTSQFEGLDAVHISNGTTYPFEPLSRCSEGAQATIMGHLGMSQFATPVQTNVGPVTVNYGRELLQADELVVSEE